MKTFKIILLLSLTFNFALNISFGLGTNDLKHYQLKGFVQTVIISKEWLSENDEWKKENDILEFDLGGNITNKLLSTVLSGNPLIYKGKKEVKIDSEKEYPKFVVEYNNYGLLIDTKVFDQNGELSDQVSTIYDYDKNNNWVRKQVVCIVEKYNKADNVLSIETRSLIYYGQ